MPRFMKTAAAGAADPMHRVVDDVQTLLRDAGDSAGSTVHEFKRRVGMALDAARERLDRVDDSVRSGTRQAVSVTDDYAHAHPWHVLAAGALVGLAIGVLFARR